MTALWDRGNVHCRSRAARAYQADHPAIETGPFPGHAPGANPDEGVQVFARFGRLANLAPADAEELRAAPIEGPARLHRAPLAVHRSSATRPPQPVAAVVPLIRLEPGIMLRTTAGLGQGTPRPLNGGLLTPRPDGLLPGAVRPLGAALEDFRARVAAGEGWAAPGAGA